MIFGNMFRVKGGTSNTTCIRQAEGPEERADFGKLMRKNAFLEEKTCYKGEVDAKMPTLTTPPAASSMAAFLESDYAPPPVGIQTVSRQLFLGVGINLRKFGKAVYYFTTILHPLP